MTAADTLGNMKVLDEWRAAVGLEFELEKPYRRTTTLAGRPLKKPAPMRRKHLPGLARAVSVISFGGALLETYTHAGILLDAYYEAGGNLLDSAWLYRMGRIDGYYGDWMAARGVRDEMVLIGKGAHSPLVYPDVIGRQLSESLDRLKTDHIEIYFMHRDNPAVPVGEFVDAMDAEVSAGRIGIYGGSNWTMARMDAAFAKHELAFVITGYVFLVALTFAFTHVLSGRGAFNQIGAIIGTIMVANVFLNIIPNQRKTVAALIADN